MREESPVKGESEVLRVIRSKAERKAYYNKIACVYDLLAEHSERGMRDLGLTKLAAKLGERVLEIGFGTGHSLVSLAEAVGPSGRVFGIDISENMVARAETLLTAEGLIDRVELQVGDAEQLPYATDTLDAIFMSFTLELFDTPEIPRVLGECRRVLRPGGRIVVVGISREGKPGFMVHAFEWTHRHFPNLMDCRPIYVRRALEAAGFQIQEAGLEHMWVPVEVVLAVNP